MDNEKLRLYFETVISLSKDPYSNKENEAYGVLTVINELINKALNLTEEDFYTWRQCDRISCLSYLTDEETYSENEMHTLLYIIHMLARDAVVEISDKEGYNL